VGRGRRLGRRAGVHRPLTGLPLDPDLEPTDPSAPAAGHRRVPVPVRRSHPGVLAAIAAGGFLGALARYELELSWPTRAGHFPASTFVINTSGAFLLGLVLTVTIERDRNHRTAWRYIRLFSCVGFLGAWTTMSTIAVEADTLVRGGHPVGALGYVAATVAAGLAAAVAGGALGRQHRRVAR
jgi:fluoride exporter